MKFKLDINDMKKLQEIGAEKLCNDFGIIIAHYNETDAGYYIKEMRNAFDMLRMENGMLGEELAHTFTKSVLEMNSDYE